MFNIWFFLLFVTIPQASYVGMRTKYALSVQHTPIHIYSKQYMWQPLHVTRSIRLYNTHTLYVSTCTHARTRCKAYTPYASFCTTNMYKSFSMIGFGCGRWRQAISCAGGRHPTCLVGRRAKMPLGARSSFAEKRTWTMCWSRVPDPQSLASSPPLRIYPLPGTSRFSTTTLEGLQDTLRR